MLRSAQHDMIINSVTLLLSSVRRFPQGKFSQKRWEIFHI